MRAIILGATGAVGQDLLEALLADPSYEQVKIFVRRNPGRTHPKLITYVVDFDHLEHWQEELQGEVLFSCLGTTLQRAGSKEKQYQVDFTYQYRVAEQAVERGVRSYILVSSVMASAQSRLFYTRMKGELEEAVSQLPYKRITILRPPTLIRRGSGRLAERLGVSILRALNSLGLFQKQRPMPTEVVARCMIASVEGEGRTVLEPADIWRLVGDRVR